MPPEQVLPQAAQMTQAEHKKTTGFGCEVENLCLLHICQLHCSTALHHSFSMTISVLCQNRSPHLDCLTQRCRAQWHARVRA